MTINSGKKYYYMNANDRKINITEFLDEQGPSNNSGNNSTNENKTNETTDQTQTDSSTEGTSSDDGFVTVTNSEE